MPSILLASENSGKLAEFQSLLVNLPLTLVTPAELGIHLDVAETGATYAENAALKALAFMRASGMVTLADDSGLEVDALDGCPGLHSHRFTSQANATDADRRAYLLSILTGKPRPWLAHFHCTIAIATPTGQVSYADGDCPGEISPQECGSHGFGYDPIFYLREQQRTMAELDEGAKNQISHRGLAIKTSIPILQSLFKI